MLQADDDAVEIARLALEYLQTLLWPALLAAAVVWLREPLKKKFAELLRLKGPGGFEADFGKDAASLQTAIAEPAAVLTHTPSTEGPEQTAPSDGWSEDYDRRIAFDRIIRQTFAIGHRIGSRQPDENVLPVIEWNNAGQPDVDFILVDDDTRANMYRFEVRSALKRTLKIARYIPLSPYSADVELIDGRRATIVLDNRSGPNRLTDSMRRFSAEIPEVRDAKRTLLVANTHRNTRMTDEDGSSFKVPTATWRSEDDDLELAEAFLQVARKQDPELATGGQRSAPAAR